MPYDVGTVSVGRPTIYDSGDFPALFERALERFGWTEKVTEGENGRRRAMGLAAIVEPSGLGPFEGAGVAIDASGRVEIRTGATSQGQGQETTLAQVAASVLGVDLDRIRVRHGDTALIPFGSGTYASRAAIMAGNAVRLASQAVRDAALETAATLLQTDASSLRLEGGAAVVADDPARSVSLGDIARALAPGSTLLKASPADAQFEDAAGLAATRYVRAVPAGAAVFAVHLAEVAVDPATGEIAVTRALVAADVGRAINPAIVEGQLVGGFLQGLGGTLLEELAYDDAGQLITATFADYPLPGAWEAPAIEVLIVEASPAPGNGLGVKGVGEIGTSGAGAAIANAVARALGEPGRRLTSLPLTPDRVLGLLAGMPETVP
jgi:CO/xanthine dehydrogenase Mo-binding subunit